ncbi:flagellar basal body rod protein FlgC [Caldinitratiruptor microaerophilus]|uniref:Flagellar basal-body rod protein FlgC n=1 Tax=Caldinitratiruptor microaerophilus TaxID=671077 RepID=A0AA35CI37_9FIRM|nr:flagellar basal body rod protein FlgC [Caldinitratiruptor microaerophilus]BDG59347.1 flagellar basal-body rod protein FlgC [Caldinitratiruptor microaerophilus]
MWTAWFRGLEISASGLTAERLRMDVIANNIANANTTRTADGPGPYRRRVVVLAAREPQPDFGTWLARFLGETGAGPWGPQPAAIGDGVRVVRVATDPSPTRRKYDPAHPDAGPDGYVELPNVDPITEMVDLIGATRAYEANVTALNATKAMMVRALEIGR